MVEPRSALHGVPWQVTIVQCQSHFAAECSNPLEIDEMNNQTTVLLFGSDLDGDDPDLRLAYHSVEAFWRAYEQNKRWWTANMGRPIIDCCILCALTVRDILRAAGRQDAQVFRSGVDLRCDRDGGGWLTVGGPDSPAIDRMWPAHMTVKMGKYLIDPTSGQFRRPWNDLSRSIILKANDDPGVPLTLQENVMASVYTWSVWEVEGRIHQLAYFKLTREIQKRTRDWQSAPDADLERRKRIVEDAMSILSK